MYKFEIDMTREWLMMLQDYCVNAEHGQPIPPESMKAMNELLSVLSVNVKSAEESTRGRT